MAGDLNAGGGSSDGNMAAGSRAGCGGTDIMSVKRWEERKRERESAWELPVCVELWITVGTADDRRDEAWGSYG